MNGWKEWLHPLPVLRTLVIVLVVGYAFALGFLFGRLSV